jgi:hypothetical protein
MTAARRAAFMISVEAVKRRKKSSAVNAERFNALSL